MPRFRANLYLPPFQARIFHTQLSPCPNMESTSSTPSASKKDIIRKSVTSSHHPAILSAEDVGQGNSIQAQNAPPCRSEMRDESAESKGKPPNPTAFAVQVVPGLLTCVCFITAGPITKLCAWGEEEWRTCAMRDDEPRPVWMSLLIKH